MIRSLTRRRPRRSNIEKSAFATRNESGRRWHAIRGSSERGQANTPSAFACILLLCATYPFPNHAQETSLLEPPGVHARIFEDLKERTTACNATTDAQRCVLNAIWETAGTMGTPALIANFDYNSDGLLSRVEVLRDSDFARWVSEIEKQRSRLSGPAFSERELSERITEALLRLQRDIGTPSQRQVTKEHRGDMETLTDREKLAAFCAEVPQSALCGDSREEGVPTTPPSKKAHTEQQKTLAAFCAEVPQSALCRDL